MMKRVESAGCGCPFNRTIPTKLAERHSCDAVVLLELGSEPGYSGERREFYGNCFTVGDFYGKICGECPW